MKACVGELLQHYKERLEGALGLDPDSARIEAQCLLQDIFQANRAWLLAHTECILDTAQLAHCSAIFKRRLLGEPIAYILGEREFYGLNFKVSPATLIPRPETELLVDLALQRIPLQGKCRVLDLGTGTGIIALSIAKLRPGAEVLAVDASLDALAVSQENARRLSLSNVEFLLSNWFDALCSEQFDLIVSNPPYIAENDIHLTQGDTRFEPRSALISGAEGLNDLSHIAVQAPNHLNDNGILLLEHGYDQAARVRSLLIDAQYSRVFSAKDLAGIERVTGGSRL